MSHGRLRSDTPELRRALAALAVAGDRDAFACLYSLCHAGFVRIAYRLCDNPDAARDIVQEAAITMSRKIGNLKDPTAFRAWGCRIIRYRVQDYFRRIERRPDSILFDDMTEAVTLPDVEMGLSLSQCLDALDEGDRRLLLLFYVDGLTGREISETLGVPLGTIKSRLFSIRKKFKHIYDHEGDPNE